LDAAADLGQVKDEEIEIHEEWPEG